MFKFDTHMHFDLYGDRRTILDQIEKNKIYTIAVTNIPQVFEKYFYEFDWEKLKYARLALGFHPELVSSYSGQLDRFVKLLPLTRYIGEIGLDYTGLSAKGIQVQRDVLKIIIDESSKYKNKIFSIHSRNAINDVLELLKASSGTIILHWFTGSINMLHEAINRGYYFSINHQMINSDYGRKLIKSIPIDRMLIESDAPFTFGMRDKYSEFFIKVIYEYICKEFAVSEENLSLQFKNNFKNVLI